MRKSETYRNEIKSYIVRAGMTMTEVVDYLSDEYGWSRNAGTSRQSFRRFTPTSKSSGPFTTTFMKCSMSRNARMPLHGRKNRKSNAKEGIAY